MKISQLPPLLKLSKAFKIIIKYCRDDYLAAEHDEIWIGDERSHPKKIDFKDKKCLRLCGFYWDPEVERWHTFV